MAIGCVGWGSLIWDLGRDQQLPIEGGWHEDGPSVPVEFVRHSDSGLVTLVIEPTAAALRTLWAVMASVSLQDAKQALAAREGTHVRNIGSWSAGEAAPAAIGGIAEWAASKKLAHVIWTGLPSKFDGVNRKTPTVDEVIKLLSGMEEAKRVKAERYIRRAPRQIATAYRKRIEEVLGWLPTDA